MKNHLSAATQIQPVTINYHKLPVVIPLFFSLSLYIFISFLFATPSSAATTTQCNPSKGQDFACLGEAVNATILGPTNITNENMTRNTSDLFTSLIVSLHTFLGGSPATGTQNPQLPYNPYLQGGGFIGAAGTSLALIYDNPPNRFINKDEFFRQALANNILNPAPAYAAGVDTLSKTGMMALWRLMRNVAYIGLAVALAIFGLMVMFRAKADPRTVITFQMALPKVAIALVLIYFSFSLSGLMLDIGEVTTQIVKSFFEAPPGVLPPLPNPKLLPGHPLSAVNYSWPVTTQAGSLFTNFFLSRGLDFDIVDIKIMGVDVPFVAGTFNFTVGTIIRIFVIFVLLHIIFTVISRYIQLLLQTAFAPVSFLASAFPGQEGGVGRWFKQMLVNVLTFPGVYLVINIANYIRLYNFDQPTPLPTAMGVEAAKKLSGLLAIGVLVLAPKVPAILEQLFDIVPGAHVSRAGVEPGAILKGVPLVGKLVG